MSLSFAQQEQLRTIDRLAAAVREHRETISSIEETYGPRWVKLVTEHLALQGYVVTPAAENRRMAMRHKHALDKLRKEQAKEWEAAGHEIYRPSQATYTETVRTHLDSCESGEYPTAGKTAQAVVGDKAPKLLAKTSKTRLRKAFDDNKEHPGMKCIKNLVSNSTITAAASGTVSTCLGALVDAHKLARLMSEQQQRTEALESRLAEVEAEAAMANARLDLKDAGKDWKEAARAIRAVEPGITNTALGLRVGKSEGAIRKYLNSVEA